MIKIKLKHVLSFVLASSPLSSMAQVADEKHTFPLEPTFVLIVVAGSLAMMVGLIYFLAKNMTVLLKAIIDKSKETPKAPVIVLFMLVSSLLPSFVHAQGINTTIAPTTDWFNYDHIILYLLIGVYATLLIVIIWLANYFMKMMNEVYGKPEVEKEVVVHKSTLDKVLDVFNKSVPVEKEQDVMLDHNYDGIRELDNSLPPWWKYGFYITIVFAFIYMYRFHVSGSGKLSADEYKEEMDLAALQKQEMLKKDDQKVDENSVVQLTDAASLADVKSIFTNVCSACHGMNGEGGVGPNLTDKYWLHGGDIKNVFKTITYGVPAKGMVAWGQTYKPSDIQKLASYVLSLQGTTPANAKAPQGELLESKASAPSDTVKAVKDTSLKAKSI